MPLKHTILPLILLLLAACSRPQTAEIVRLDLAESDTLTAELAAWCELTGVDSMIGKSAFAPRIREELPPLDSVERVLGSALAGRNLEYVGVVNPFKQPVIVSDTLVFIGLNHYLGSNSDVYRGFPDYMRRLKTIGRLPVDVVEEVIYSESDVEEPANVLEKLLLVGAIHNKALHLLPKGTSEAVLLGMTAEEYAWCQANEQRIWAKIIEDGLLYSTDPNIVDKLFAPSPAATIININAPGNTAHYIGLKIAQAYERNAGTDAEPTMLYVKDKQTLVKSQYNPQNATR